MSKVKGKFSADAKFQSIDIKEKELVGYSEAVDIQRE